MNKENFKKVLDKIKKYPDSWDQGEWHCGTSHCFAGHCQIEAGNPISNELARRDAREFLEISNNEATFIFDSDRSIEDFEDILLGAVDVRDDDGYNMQGFNRSGYNRRGYDSEGYSSNGRDWGGYDRKGYDRYGFDIKGFNEAGYDRDGLDKNNKPNEPVLIKPTDKTS